MSRFNPKSVSTVTQAYSANGNLQDVKSLEQQAVEILFNTLYGRDSFYESTDEKAQRLEAVVNALVAKGKLDFVANLLLFARSEMNVRNMPVMGLKAFSKAIHNNGVSFSKLRRVTSDVIQRADQITDTLALFIKEHGKNSLPMAIKRGLSDAFNKFDEYQFAKYDRKNAVTFKDALRIVHPIPKAESNSVLFHKIMEDALASADTWEKALSATGQKETEGAPVSKKEAWEDLIDRDKLGYQAMLKNLRNMVLAGVSEPHLHKVAEALVRRVTKGKSLPFEFWTAREEFAKVSNFRPILNALEKCMDITAKNIPTLGRKVWIVMDISASMRGRALDTAAFFTAAIAKAHADADYLAVTQFASHAGQTNINPNDSVWSNFVRLKNTNLGGSTNFEAALAQEKSLGFTPDIVFVLTDGEINSFGQNYGYYRNSTEAVTKCAPGAQKFVINMESAESTPLPSRHGWVAMAGWNTRMFDLIELGREKASIINKLNKPYPYTEFAL